MALDLLKNKNKKKNKGKNKNAKLLIFTSHGAYIKKEEFQVTIFYVNCAILYAHSIGNQP